ncbi:MAG: hypothetical protein KBT81_17335, partial [Oleispira antarctica]|nr:hypothetical protein [Oleispira antarctica]
AFGISFTSVETANSGAAGILNGTTAEDKFVVAGTQSVATNGTTFNQVTSVTAGDGDDDVQYDSASWTIQGTEATSIEGMAFTDVESINQFNSTNITNRNLNGTTGQDLLNIEGTNTISANGITYYGIGTVDALGNSTADLDTVSGSTTWDLLADGFKAFGISFTGVEVANSSAAGILNGTTAADKFVVAGTQSVAANGTTFNQVTSVTANDGDDDVQYNSADWTIQETKATSIEGIAFTDVESINQFNSTDITNRTLTGTAGQDLLTIESANTINAKGITYYGIGSVDTLGNSEVDLDTVSGSTTWDLLASGFEAFDISFAGVEIADSGAAGTLNGTTDADKFVVAGTQSVTANGTTFNQVTSVTAGDGDDDVQYDSADWTIQGTEASSIEGIAFTDVESINQFNSTGITTRNLNGTAGQDLLNIEGTNAISANGITYYGIGSVDALGNSEVDLDTVSGSTTWNLLASGFEAFDISFTGVEIANSGAAGTLNGTNAADKFVVTGTQSVAANGTTFNQVTAVTAGDGDDDVQNDSANWTMAGAKATRLDDISFTNIETINKFNSLGVTNRNLNGTYGKNQFNIKGTNAISANGITYYGIGKVDGKTGAGQLDTVSGSNAWDLLTTGFKASGISFFNIEVANSGNNGTVNGTNSKDDIVILNTQSVAANGTRFNQVTNVDTKDNAFSGDLDTVSGSNNWTLLVNSFESSGISFTNIDVANSGENGTLNGSDYDDAFVIKGTQSITANGTTFNQIAHVDAKGGAAASGIDTVSGSNTWNLLAAGFESSGIRFINTEMANSSANGSLNGTELKDEFMIIGNQSVVANGTTFNQVASIDAKDSSGTNELDTVSGSSIWTLLSDGFESTGIRFTHIEIANSGSAGKLNGTNNDDQFIIKGSQSVAANGTTFNQVVDVDARDASSFGGMDTVSGSNTWDLLSVGFSAEDIHFTNTEVANSEELGTVNGTEFNDEFVISGIQSVKANGTTFNQVSKVDAKNNTLGQFDTVSGSNAWDILSNGFKASAINFFNVEVANSGAAGLVNGTELKDEFEITGTQSVAINGITFNQVTQVDAKGNTVEGELDTVSGSNTWDLLSEGFKASEISFLNTEVANSSNKGSINGTSNTDEFYLAGLQSVTVNNTTFNQVTSVNAKAGDNKLVGMETADEFNLFSTSSTAGSNKVTSQEIDFASITHIDGGTGENRVHGSAGSDSFQLTDTRQELISNNMTFNNIQAVVAADGEDNLIGQDGQRWQVSNIDNTIVAQDIRFSEIETVSNSGLGILIGSDQADQFVLASSNGSATDNAVMVNQLVFSNIGSIDAGESELGEDVVTSDIEQTWQLADDNNFIVNGILLSNIERANAAASTVMGSISEDVFVTTDITNTVIANDVYFENVTLLDGDNPGLTLTYSADLDAQQNNLNNFDQVAAADKFITNSNNSIVITQGDGVDSFSQSGNQAGFSFDFKNIEVVDIVTTGDVNSTSGFEYLTIDASNLSINTSEDITFNDFDITNDLTINTKGDLIFLNDVEFTGKDVSVSGDNVSFRGGLKIASNTFAIAANKLNVEGDIDADVNAERSVATDIGQDINASIFNSIDIFLASDSSILRKDEIDNADRLKRLLEETELEL